MANTKVPIPTTAVNAEKKIAVLWEFRIAFPVRYLFWSPSMMKILKSSPIPKMKVERIILIMLNSRPRIPIRPKIMVQLISIGRKLIRVNSIRPYEINRARNIRNEEI